MNFQSPMLLWLLLLLIPAAYALHAGRKKTAQLLILLREDPISPKRDNLRQALSLILLASMCLTAAGPHYQLSLPGQGGTGRFVFLIDVSRSMAARAVCDDPTQLDRARALMKTVIKAMPAAEFAIAGFTELTFPFTELSNDHRYLEDVIEQALFVETVPMPGSDIANALLVVAEKKLIEPTVYAGVENIILISDGDFSEDISRQLIDTLPQIREAGFKVTTVGIGPEEGLPIPTLDKNRQCLEGRYERAEGKEFQARLFTAPLQQIAGTTGGRYFDGAQQDELVSWLRSTLQAEQADDVPIRTLDLAPFSLLLATIALALLVYLRRF